MKIESPEDTDVAFRNFVLLSFLSNFNDNIDHVERLHLLSYLLDQKLSNDIWIFKYSQQKGILHSSQINECLEELIEQDQIIKTTSRTFGGDQRTSYTITDEGRKAVTKSRNVDGFEKLNKYITQTVSEYGSIPISNLVEIARS